MVMHSKKGNQDLAQLIVVGFVFIVIMTLLFQGNVFVTVFNAFNIPVLGVFGPILGILFILLIIVSILARLLER